jgi:hypothetical protein
VITLKRDGRSGSESRERSGYEETGAMQVVVIDEEKEKALKIGYMTLHANLFGTSQKMKWRKPKSFLYPMISR